MQSIFYDLPYVRVYIDDLVVFSESVSEHGAHLAEFVLRLTKASLRLRPKKCSF